MEISLAPATDTTRRFELSSGWVIEMDDDSVYCAAPEHLQSDFFEGINSALSTLFSELDGSDEAVRLAELITSSCIFDIEV
jgi:hypothetical protein